MVTASVLLRRLVGLCPNSSLLFIYSQKLSHVLFGQINSLRNKKTGTSACNVFPEIIEFYSRTVERSGFIPVLTPGEKRIKYRVGDVDVMLISELVQYYGKDGKLITESLRDYTKKAVETEYSSLDDFLEQWTNAGKKAEIVSELENAGVLFEALREEVGRDYDPFDLICHVAYGQPPLTRKERAENVRKRNYFAKYEAQARKVLESLLLKYSNEGLKNLEDMSVLKVQPICNLGTPLELVKAFGGKAEYILAIQELEHQLYSRDEI